MKTIYTIDALSELLCTYPGMQIFVTLRKQNFVFRLAANFLFNFIGFILSIYSFKGI